MRKAIPILVLVFVSAILSLPTDAFGQNKSQQQDPFQHPFANPIDDSSLPRVLIIGDSISIGYTPRVRRLLDDKANVHRPTTNCRWSDFGDEQIENWVGDSKWDVIHFNFGLWDWYGWSQDVKATPESYAKSLESIVGKLKKTNAQLIFAVTTPPCVGPERKVKFVITQQRAQEFNDAAEVVMKKHGVLINDLYAAIGKDRAKYQRGQNDVHYTEEGSEILATRVARAIRTTLPEHTQQRWDSLYEPQVFEGMPCRVMKPLGFDAEKSYPVIVSLHGAGGKGTNNDKQLKDWNRQLAEKQRRKDFPCYVVAPQATGLWNAEHLKKIKNLIKDLPSVDMDRIYIMGHSMGGHGTYIFIQLDSDYFAAAAPSAGSGLKRTEKFIVPAKIKNVPIWAFHGDKDGVCPIEKDQEVFAEVKKLGGNMKLTTWAGDNHGVSGKMIVGGENGTTQFSSDRCDKESDFMTWLFAQSRKKIEK